MEELNEAVRGTTVKSNDKQKTIDEIKYIEIKDKE